MTLEGNFVTLIFIAKLKFANAKSTDFTAESAQRTDIYNWRASALQNIAATHLGGLSAFIDATRSQNLYNTCIAS